MKYDKIINNLEALSERNSRHIVFILGTKKLHMGTTNYEHIELGIHTFKTPEELLYSVWGMVKNSQMNSRIHIVKKPLEEFRNSGSYYES